MKTVMKKRSSKKGINFSILLKLIKENLFKNKQNKIINHI